MKASNAEYYPIERSPIYRLKSPHVLARLLKIELVELRDLCAHGDGNFKQFPLGTRWIETPKEKLKIVQRRIHNLLCRIEPPDYLFSAYRGRSAVSNANYHLENAAQCMLKVDVRKFYPSSHGKRVFALFAEDFLCSPDIAWMLTKLCTIGATSNSGWRHLPTGGTTSPILAFMAYRKMFEELSNLAENRGLKFSVLADDVTYSGPDAGVLRSKVEEIMASYDLRAHRKKYKSWSAEYGNKIVTGAMVTPKGLRVPRKLKVQIQELSNAVSNEVSPTLRSKFYQRLVGSLSAAAQIEVRFKRAMQLWQERWESDSEAWGTHRRESIRRKFRLNKDK